MTLPANGAPTSAIGHSVLRRGFLVVLAGAPIASQLEAEVPEMPKRVQDAIRTRHLDEEPLDVQVARALGWTDFDKDGFYSAHPPYYSTDWSATGPLIQKYRITVQAPSGDAHTHWGATKFDEDDRSWLSDHLEFHEAIYNSKTPLEAVCRFLLALHATGELP